MTANTDLVFISGVYISGVYISVYLVVYIWCVFIRISPGKDEGRVHRVQLGGHPVDAEPHPSLRDGDLCAVEHLRGPCAPGKAGLQYPQVH